jgi:DNA polymerase V
LRFHDVAAGRLTIMVQYKTGHTGVGRASLVVPSDRFDVLLETARPCLRRAWMRGVQATHMHVIAEDLVPRGQSAPSLFDPPAQRIQAESVARLKEQINNRIGRFSLRSAVTLYLPSIYRDTANAYDICDVRGKICF